MYLQGTDDSRPDPTERRQRGADPELAMTSRQDIHSHRIGLTMTGKWQILESGSTITQINEG
jgi:hypothetical protein